MNDMISIVTPKCTVMLPVIMCKVCMSFSSVKAFLIISLLYKILYFFIICQSKNNYDIGMNTALSQWYYEVKLLFIYCYSYITGCLCISKHFGFN